MPKLNYWYVTLNIWYPFFRGFRDHSPVEAYFFILTKMDKVELRSCLKSQLLRNSGSSLLGSLRHVMRGGGLHGRVRG